MELENEIFELLKTVNRRIKNSTICDWDRTDQMIIKLNKTRESLKKEYKQLLKLSKKGMKDVDELYYKYIDKFDDDELFYDLMSKILDGLSADYKIQTDIFGGSDGERLRIYRQNLTENIETPLDRLNIPEITKRVRKDTRTHAKIAQKKIELDTINKDIRLLNIIGCICTPKSLDPERPLTPMSM
jgi:hypothetical protein